MDARSLVPEQCMYDRHNWLLLTCRENSKHTNTQTRIHRYTTVHRVFDCFELLLLPQSCSHLKQASMFALKTQ